VTTAKARPKKNIALMIVERRVDMKRVKSVSATVLSGEWGISGPGMDMNGWAIVLGWFGELKV